MSTEDLQIMIRHLLVAFAVIAVLVAGPLLWGDLSQPGSADAQRVAQLQTGPSLPSP